MPEDNINIIHLCFPNLKKKNLKITEFMPFPWEKLQKEKKKLSESELKTMFERWDKAEFKSQK